MTFNHGLEVQPNRLMVRTVGRPRLSGKRRLRVVANQMDQNLAIADRLRLEFNDWARAGRGEGMEKGHRPVGEQAIELMAIPSDAQVLDVGCGSGWATRLI